MCFAFPAKRRRLGRLRMNLAHRATSLLDASSLPPFPNCKPEGLQRTARVQSADCVALTAPAFAAKNGA